MLLKFKIDQALTIYNYHEFRQKVIDSPVEVNQTINYRTTLFVHFTYCTNMKSFPKEFHKLWDKYFSRSPINDIIPTLATRNAKNLHRELVNTR